MNFFKSYLFSFVTLAIVTISCNKATKETSINENKTVSSKQDRDTSVHTTPLVIWFLQPAHQHDTLPYIHNGSTNIHGDAEGKGWDEALPIGNGRLGAMVFGGTKRERIQLNESTLWKGKNIKKTDPELPAVLSEIRKMIFDEKYAEAASTAESKLTGTIDQLASYQPLADLYIELTDMNYDTPVSDYYRDLHIDSAIATVHFRIGDKLITREVFASYTDNVIVVKLKSDKPGGINAKVSLMREAGAETFRSPFDSTLLIQRGSVAENGLLFETQVKASYSGGTVRNGTKQLVCQNVDEITLYISAATNYEYKEHAVAAKQMLLAAMSKPYDQLRADHIASYKNIFNTLELNLNFVDKAYDIPTDKRVEKVKSGVEDNYLTELLFQYGRYLLISSSRPKSYPANMQGLWNEHLTPLNGSGYKTAWSLPLIYSFADITGLSELKSPLFKLVDTCAIFGADAATSMYGTKGWVAHDYVSIFGNDYPTLHQTQSIAHTGGVWLAAMYYDTYLFNRDKEFLKNKVLPIVKGSAEFILNNLQEVPSGKPLEGKLVINPSLSNGNSFVHSDGTNISVGYASTIDQMLAKDILTIAVSTIDELSSKNYKFEPQLRARASDALTRLALVDTKSTTLPEWVASLKEADELKSSIPQLYGLFPSNQISASKTPELAKAAESLLKSTLSLTKQSSYTYSLASIWYARLGNAEAADANLLKHVQNSISTNLLSSSPPFAIDGSMGFTTAVTEMLVQSHEGFLKFAPALPANWEVGNLKGFVARGGYTGTIEWSNAKVYVSLFSKSDQTCKIYSETPIKVFDNGTLINVKKEDEKIYVFEIQKNKLYNVAYAKRSGSSKSSGSKGMGIWPDLGLGIDLGINL
ncbi:MAG: glycoside hydrolase family 95 protein [Bacteroidota bacterium]|nr:glycoside hydrolase family 95 protein [Bacteroidota bacterium]